jgi:ADP-heptose:LPS heptosyltransferase
MRRNGPILVVRAGAMGDMVQFSGVLAALADHHDQPVDVLSDGGFTAEVLVGMPEVGRFFAMKHRRRPLWLAPDLSLLARALAERRYAQVYPFDRAPVIERALAASGAEFRFGHIDPVRFGTPGLDVETESLCSLGVEVSGRVMPRVVASAAERRAAVDLVCRHGQAGRPVIVVQAGNARTLHPLHRLRPTRNLKAWPVASWVGAVNAIAEAHPEAAIAFAGAPSEWGVAEEIRLRLAPGVRQRAVNLAQELPVRTLAGLFAEAFGCLSIDTGPAHLAAALGCPTVVLFGPADPRDNAPRGPAPVVVVRSGVACSPCYGTARRKTCRENLCMSQIPVTQVVAAWHSLALGSRLRLAPTAA